MHSLFQRSISIALLGITVFTSFEIHAIERHTRESESSESKPPKVKPPKVKPSESKPSESKPSESESSESESSESDTFEPITQDHKLLFGNGKLFHEIKKLLQAQDYVKLGVVLRHAMKNKRERIEEVRQIARELASPLLLRVLDATAAVSSIAQGLGITVGEIAQISLFMEVNLPLYVQKGVFYIPKHATNLACSLEFDPVSGDRFIVLNKEHDAFLGAGKYKVVYKAIFYDVLSPQIVARAEQQTGKDKELQITKLLQGLPGIYKTIAFTQHFTHQKGYITIYSKLYRPGTLRHAFDKHYRFSLFEKMKIALNILIGLQELHSRNIIHRDLSARNYLIDIPPGPPARRDVVAVISDLGRADYASAQFDSDARIQGNTSYTSPEALFKKRINGCKFFSCEVYALGLVLYELFYEKTAPWQNSKYVRSTSRSVHSRCRDLSRKINHFTKSRKRFLARKIAKGRATPSELFEALILRMCDPDPIVRGSAAELAQQVQQILSSV